MKVRVEFSVEVPDNLRLAHRKIYGETPYGLATRGELKFFFAMNGRYGLAELEIEHIKQTDKAKKAPRKLLNKIFDKKGTQ